MKMPKFVITMSLFLMFAFRASNFGAAEGLAIGQSQYRLGLASWYSEDSPGINERTANMEIFDDSEFTCAMWGVEFDTFVKVTNLENGKSVVLRVNDRGPAKRLVRKGRIIDLTKTAFARIASLRTGLISVKVEFV